ncbi:hypothetical protein PC129_g7425 [Phytophthora cactorum]|uniref:Uncharacterized protein n=1 Tax=Phytophthora cactorum TaxID=29920 RepID=A0A329SKU9_9STRA|nr:hypothetical protein Pcac1_g27338 [Phytophthora cactorum]KAG2829036.1 hypothetical protein PC111_g7937 [Phytophthora cactorum]KAG2838148.1 hypothetical protein PC112_g4626 [Phytophthora cactorum]KAG2864599.1 hypothetical protein PC113_g4422 [Phytophthora cactorum]KAG2909602.1 hypothetical protein PC114_g10076 [Phytophthora cactorum]
MVQGELLHDLVERSRERVMQVRAGSSLLHVLHQQQLHALPQLSSSTSLPLLPPAPSLAIAPRCRPRNILHAQVADEGNTKDRRRRGALPRIAKDVVQLPDATTSFEQYRNFMANKIYREETMHLQNRRAALVPRDDLLKKLATVCAAALKEMENEEEAPAVRESLRGKLLRAMALLRGGRAFEQAKTLAPPPPPAYGDIKNAHLAFLQFKSDDASATKQKRVHPSAGLQEGNTSTKTPIHFGDRICLLSSSSDLPLAIGPDGRCHPAQDSSAGPHMTFTIVDFRNPSRYDEVTATDDFWLRVDPTVLAPRMFDPRRLHANSGSGEDSDPTDDGGGDGDVASLLSDTSYYLGCPGWLDEGESNSAPLLESSTSTQKGITHAGMAATDKDRRLRGQQRFRLVAMKALTPSRDYYGDDAATREYAMETNEGIMRLARWRFVRYSPRKHEQVHVGGKTANVRIDGLDNEQDVNDAMVNCSTVYLVLSDFALVYDKSLKRGVGVRVSSEPSAEVLKVKKTYPDKKTRRRQHSDSGVVANAIVHLSACARWQVRILQRTGGLNYLQELELAMAAVTGDFRKEDGARVEWLREKQEKMASNDRRLHAKTRLVPDARRQYDLVVSQSNSKLAQIERQKGAQAPEYFQRRLQALESMESGHQLCEIMHLKQQQLHQVFELPHL